MKSPGEEVVWFTQGVPGCSGREVLGIHSTGQDLQGYAALTNKPKGLKASNNSNGGLFLTHEAWLSGVDHGFSPRCLHSS